jgi:hypothetical protein
MSGSENSSGLLSLHPVVPSEKVARKVSSVEAYTMKVCQEKKIEFYKKNISIVLSMVENL